MKITKKIREERAKQLQLHYRDYGDDEFAIKENIHGSQYYTQCHFNKNDIWIDAGAHIGTFTCMISPFVKRIFSFEIEPATFSFLEANVKLNCKNVKPLYAGIGPSNSLLPIYRPTTYPERGTSVSLIEVTDSVQCEEVSCIDINTVIEITGANKMKIDIEGMEESVLYAITNENWEHIEEFVCEWHFKFLHDLDHEQFHQMLQHIENKGFKIHHREQSTRWNGVFYAVKI